MSSSVASLGTVRSVVLRTFALALALAAAMLALMGSGGGPTPGRMERSSFRGGAGYWLLAKDGGVFAFGDAKFFGPNRNQGQDIAGMAATATGNGYWTVDDDGDVFAYGDAVDFGSRPGPEIDNITGFAARTQGDGYWMVARDGSVYAFGGARFLGSANTLPLVRPIVGMAATASGQGYWLIAGDGGVFAYGDAKFFGSTGNIRLARPIVDFAPSPDGQGYRFIGSDGGVFAYGSAGFFGSTGAIRLNLPVVGFAGTASGKGYWLAAEDGGVFTFGDAQFHGSTGAIKLNASIVAIVATPRVKVAPIAQDDTATTNEDTAVTIDVEANDTHVLPATVSVESNPTKGTASVQDGKIVYIPSPNANGSDSFKYTLTDSAGHSATGTVTVTVTPVNDAPTISNVANQTTNEDTPTGAIAVSVADIDSGTLTVSAGSSNTTLVPNASLAVGGTGGARTVTATPAANQNGTSTITLTVSDGSLSSSDTFVLTVAPVNDAPTISAVADRSVNENGNTGAVAFTVGDAETAAAGLTVTSSSDNDTLVPDANVVVGGSGENRTVTVTPATNQFGTATITLMVSDGTLSAIETFVVTVNDTPTIGDIGDATAGEDTPIGSPFAVGDTETAAADLQLTGSSDNDTLVPDANVTFDGSGVSRTVTVTPALNQFGSATITVTVADAGNATASDTFVVTFTPVNDAPTVSDIANQSVNENASSAAVPFTIGDAETAAGSLTVTRSSNNQTLIPDANVVLGGSGANRTVTVTPVANQIGTATITVTVSDGVLSAVDTFEVTVNDTPTISNVADQAVSEDTGTGNLPFTVGDTETAAASLTMSASSDNPTLVFSIAVGGSGANRTVTVTPAPNQFGSATITLTVTDGGGATASDTFELTVNPVNDAPTISDIADQSIDEDTNTGALPFTVGDLESAAGGLLVSGSSDNQLLVPDANVVLGGSGANRTVTVTPAEDRFGTATIIVTVSDGPLSSSDTFEITVNSVNDLPTISVISDLAVDLNEATAALGFTIDDEETPVDALLTVGLSDNDTLVPDSNVVVAGVLGSRTVTVTPATNQSGTTTITVTVTDGDGGTASETFTLTVVDDQPVAVDNSVSIAGLVTSDINVLGNDTGLEDEPITVTIVDGSLSILEGFATVNGDGTIHLVPFDGGITDGTITFDYRVTDSDGDSDTGTVTVTIQ